MVQLIPAAAQMYQKQLKDGKIVYHPDTVLQV